MEAFSDYRKQLDESNRKDYLEIYDRLELLADAFFSKNHLSPEEKTLMSFYEYIETTIKVNRDVFGKQEDDFHLIVKPFASMLYLKYKDTVS